MTGIRAWVRRGMAKDPLCVSIPDKIELVWVAQRIVRNDFDSGSPPVSRDCEWGILAGLFEPQLRDGTRINAGLDADTVIDGTTLTEQLDRLRDKKFALGFKSYSASDEDRTKDDRESKNHNGFEKTSVSPRVKAITDLISVAPKLPRGEYAHVASKLATAMTGIIEFLEGPDGSGIRWIDSYPWWQDVWQIDVQESLGVKTSWILQPYRHDHGQLTSNLTAGLSLWMYSLICANNLLKPLYNRPGALGDGVRLTSISSDRFVRIIGSTNSCNVEEMQRWIASDLLFDVPPYDCSQPSAGREFYKAIDMADKMRRNLGRWPIFGLYYSTSFEYDIIETVRDMCTDLMQQNAKS
ncbi:MAG: hypothetical protein M1821_002392 [Bathelium mastoideum]|nr:MAG: hypothetical protein M1821_002392 [Bathelium mastoideum]KAI9686398.1 MAG: hypothetical protein M1822_003743 [Bathelium mastoideum]